jgi:DNA-binding NtrC family response regulator
MDMGTTETFPSGFNLQEQVREYERNLIVNALAAAGGHQRRAAAALGIRPTTLNEKMKRLGLRRDSAPGSSDFDPRSRFGR